MNEINIYRIEDKEFGGHHTKFQQYNAPDKPVLCTFVV